MKVSILFLALAGLWLPIAGFASPAAGQELTTPARLSRTVDLRNVTADANGNVSGTLLNRSDLTLLEVRLQVDYVWMWYNDFKPAKTIRAGPCISPCRAKFSPMVRCRFPTNPRRRLPHAPMGTLFPRSAF